MLLVLGLYPCAEGYQKIFIIKVASSGVLRVFYLQMAIAYAQQQVKKPRGPKPEFPGIGADAATLGVSRYFLWQVLKGHAKSAPLLARYRALKEAN